MIEHGDVAARHVSHMNIVFVLVQTYQSATHTDHIIIRVRTKTQYFFGYLAGRMVLNGI